MKKIKLSAVFFILAVMIISCENGNNDAKAEEQRQKTETIKTKGSPKANKKNAIKVMDSFWKAIKDGDLKKAETFCTSDNKLLLGIKKMAEMFGGMSNTTVKDVDWKTYAFKYDADTLYLEPLKTALENPDEIGFSADVPDIFKLIIVDNNIKFCATEKPSREWFKK